MSEFRSWGRYPHCHQSGNYLPDRHANFPVIEDDTILPFGKGRSYGDSCLSASGNLISTKLLNNFISFDSESGILVCEAGVTLKDIIDNFLPRGWFLPVTPGTKFVTVAGAIANDVHGKNHHTAGSFGNHVLEFELLRSNGDRLICNESDNAEFFEATIGGLGLTGIISWVKLQLKPVQSAYIDSENIKYDNLNEFFQLSEDSEQDFEYTVAWIDCLAKGKSLGKGHFTRGNHAESKGKIEIPVKKDLVFPVESPISFVNKLSVSAFNQLYYHRQIEKVKKSEVAFNPFFYPLDGILHWNRMYGKKGFLQYQCVIPLEASKDGIKEMLEIISRSGLGSFLVVLKMMGNIPSKGLVSFPMEGATLALDFPFQGSKTLALLDELDKVLMQAGGRIYPAKDARMSSQAYKAAYPRWLELEAVRDPAILSGFWQRILKEAQEK